MEVDVGPDQLGRPSGFEIRGNGSRRLLVKRLPVICENCHAVHAVSIGTKCP